MRHALPPSRSREGALGVPAALGVFTALVFAVVAGRGRDDCLLAHGSGIDDVDRDGIPASQEIVIGTSPANQDSDFDGFPDGVELALQTHPMDDQVLPLTTGLSAGMTARGEHGWLKLFVAIFDDAQTVGDRVVRFAALIDGSLVYVPIERAAAPGTLEKIGVLGGELVTFDVLIDPQLIHAFGSASFFLVVGEAGNTNYLAAAVVDVASDQGVLMMRRSGRGPGSGGASQNSLSQGGGGTLYQPIPQGGQQAVPVNWVAGRICYQSAEAVGVSGPLITYQIVEANCLDGWDSFCASDCRLTTGGTYTTVDPYALIGN